MSLKMIKTCVLETSNSLAELGVNGEDLRVANKGESQDGDGVGCLEKHTIHYTYRK